MTNRAERIKTLIEQSGYSYQELENITGVKKSSLQRYASGQTVKIPLHVIEKLALSFNVSQSYLMGWDDNIAPDELRVTESDKEILELFKQIPEKDRRVLLEMVRSYANTLKKD